MSKVVICGSKDFNDYSALEKAIVDSGFKPTEILATNSKGSDANVEIYCKRNNIPFKKYVPEWDNLFAVNCKVKTNSYGKEYNAYALFNSQEEMSCYADCGIDLTGDNKDFVKKLTEKNKQVFVVGGGKTSTSAKTYQF